MLTKIKEIMSIVKNAIILMAIAVYCFVAEHMKQMIYGVALLLIIVGTFIIIRDPIHRATAIKTAKIAVRRHLRMLPEGYSHSAAKAAEAAKLGISLLDNQTIVDPYVKTIIRKGH